MRKKLLIWGLGLMMAVQLHGQNETSINDDLPDAAKVLPGPPVSRTSIRFANDYVQYNWGKTMRTASSGGKDVTEFLADDVSEYLRTFSRVINVTMSKNQTPFIYELMEYCMTIGSKVLDEAHATFDRQRPYVMFQEEPLKKSMMDKYAAISSYPSDQSFFGWLYALVLTEVCPNRQDQILDKGAEFAQGTVISGYNWESDARDANLLASALLSRLHCHNAFESYLLNAQVEYKGIASTIAPEMPSSSAFLPKPPNELSYQYVYDLAQYEEGVLLRPTDVGQQAVADVEYSAEHFCEIFSEVLGVTISASATPAIFRLLDYVHPYGNSVCQDAKSVYKRRRPYVELGTSTAYPEDEDNLRGTGSYPSGHASGSWLMALTISEVARMHQDELLARAYQFGQGRVITGYHWQSDVDAGRLVGSAAYARLHYHDTFRSLMKSAVAEYQQITTGVRSAVAAPSSPNASFYTVGGTRLQSAPSSHGVYIRNRQKVVY